MSNRFGTTRVSENPTMEPLELISRPADGIQPPKHHGACHKPSRPFLRLDRIICNHESSRTGSAFGVTPQTRTGQRWSCRERFEATGSEYTLSGSPSTQINMPSKHLLGLKWAIMAKTIDEILIYHCLKFVHNLFFHLTCLSNWGFLCNSQMHLVLLLCH